jgi:hypothetical protein
MAETAESDKRRGDPFYYHRPSKEYQGHIERVRRQYRALRETLLTLPIPPRSSGDRERSLAITHLQESLMHANAGLAISDPNGEVEE